MAPATQTLIWSAPNGVPRMVVDPLGLTIFLIGLGLLVLELANPGYFIGVAGTTGVIVGLVQMAWTDFIYGYAFSPIVVVIIAALSWWGSIQFYKRFAPPIKPPETLSSDALHGQVGKVVTRVEPDSLKGKVKIGGIVWSATSSTVIEEGTEAIVTKVDGVHLILEPKNPSPNP